MKLAPSTRSAVGARLRRTDGFAIPVTLFLVACITVMLTASMVRVRADLWSAKSSSDVTQALAIAQSGLQTYLGTVTARPVTNDSLRINVVGGYADVVAHLVRKPADSLSPWTYFVRSTGHVIEPPQGAESQAIHTVGQVAHWYQASFSPLAVLVAINGVLWAPGPVFVIDGNDECSADATGGLRAPGGSDAPPETTGSPAAELKGGWSQVAEDAGIDWEATIDGGFLPEHATVQSGDTTFGSSLVRGDVVLENTTGTGLLVVTGELETEGSFFAWDGIVLVGGEFDPDADSTVIRGMLVSGLNQTLGAAVEVNDISELSDDVYITYNSCNIRRALAPFQGFVPVENAWVDYVTGY